MLDRAGNTDSHVKIWGNNLAGLAHLPIVWRIAAVNRSTRGPNSRAQHVCQFFDQGKVFLRANAASTRDNDARRSQLGTIRFRNLVFDPLRQGRVGCCRDGFNRCSTAVAGCLKGRGPHRHDFFAIRRGYSLHGVARIDRAFECIGVNHGGDF